MTDTIQKIADEMRSIKAPDFGSPPAREAIHCWAERLTALSARAPAGEGWDSAERVRWVSNDIHRIYDCGYPPASLKLREGFEELDMALTAAPQPAQAGASGGGDGWWEGLGNEVIDGEACILYQHTTTGAQLWCRKSEHEKVDALLKGLTTPASPATGEGDSSDIPFGTVQKVVRALTRLGVSTPCSQEEQAARSVELVNDLCREVQEYFDSITAAPQAASVQGEPVVWRKPTPYGVGYNFASKEVMEDIAGWIQESFITPQPAAAHPELPSAQGWLDSHCAVATTEWMRGWDAARSALAAAAPRPQEDEKARRPCPRCDTCNDLIVIGYCRDCARTVADAAEDTPPAHGDGEVWDGEVIRAAFERWAGPQGLRLNRRDFKGSERLGQYCDDDTQLAFEAWREATRPTPEAQEARDAARYRWLRERWGRISETYMGESSQMVSIGYEEDGWEVDPTSLDDCIDAALALPAQGEGE